MNVLTKDGFTNLNIKKFKNDFKDFHSYHEQEENIVFTNSELWNLKMLKKGFFLKKNYYPKNQMEDLTKNSRKYFI